MKRLISILAAVLLSAALMCACISAFDANDYDYGGGYDYDYGGSSWDDDDDDYSYGGSYSSGGSGGGSNMTWGETLITIAIVAAFLIVGGIWANKPSKRSGKPQQAQPPRSKQVTVPNRNNEVREAVRQHDPDFTIEQMLSFASQTFIAVQNAWCAKDLEPVRGVMHNNLYNTTLKQVQAKIDQHVTYHYENYTFRNVYLTSYVRDAD